MQNSTFFWKVPFNPVTFVHVRQINVFRRPHPLQKSTKGVQCYLFWTLGRRKRCLSSTFLQPRLTLSTSETTPSEFPSPIAKSFGITSEQVSKLNEMVDLLMTESRAYNLTAIRERDAIITKHILDAFTLLPKLDAIGPRRIIDVGSGAGFPGLVLAIVRPNVHVTLLDSVRKKIAFQDQVVSKLVLPNVEPVWARAEDAAHDTRYREKYCLSVARSVAQMPTLTELCLPFVRLHGEFIAQKMVDNDNSEVIAAQRAIIQLGGKLGSITNAWPALFGDSGSITDAEGRTRTKSLIVVHKVKPTPNRFPRKAGIPTKSPLL